MYKKVKRTAAFLCEPTEDYIVPRFKGVFVLGRDEIFANKQCCK